MYVHDQYKAGVYKPHAFVRVCLYRSYRTIFKKQKINKYTNLLAIAQQGLHICAYTFGWS